jgi:capsular polysaccharide export protein
MAQAETPAIWRPTRFAGLPDRPPATLLAAPDPLAAACAAPPDAAARALAARLAPLIAAARIGGEPNLPDPGAAALGLPPRAATLVLDPCDPASEAEFAALLAAAPGPLLIARSPAAPRSAPEGPTPPGARRLTEILSPWTLLDAAASAHGLADETLLLALAAGLPVGGRLPGGARPGDALPALLAATRWRDPLSGAETTPEAAIAWLALWREREAANRRVAVCVGMQGWKRARIAALFAHGTGRPAFLRDPRHAAEAAAAAGGAIAVWASREPAALAAEAAQRGVTVLRVEDGFLRSAGLGAAFLPGASYCVDEHGPYYDPTARSGLEALLNGPDFDAALLARAQALRERVIRQGISKYNLSAGGALPDAPPGRRRILVPGQVEDDLSILRGAGAVRTNLDLLRAARAENPGAFLCYRPHPDVVAGFRRGAVPRAALAGLADAVAPDAPIAALLGWAEEVQTMTSQAGFEALLRGVQVVLHGRPWYGGWGLTEDRAAFPSRERQRALDDLVAAALILYPRCMDPVTGLPCPPEALLDRLGEPAAWPASPLAPLRRAQGAAVAALARLRGRV